MLKASNDETLLIPGGKRLGLKPGVLLSIQTRERVLGRPGTRAQVAVASRLVGEVLIVDNLDDPERESMAVGTLVSGSLKGYDVRELIVRFCQPKGYFGHDFGHDHQCSAKAAALVSVHYNIGASPKNAGAMTVYNAVRPFTAQSLRLAPMARLN